MQQWMKCHHGWKMRSQQAKRQSQHVRVRRKRTVPIMVKLMVIKVRALMRRQSKMGTRRKSQLLLLLHLLMRMMPILRMKRQPIPSPLNFRRLQQKMKKKIQSKWRMKRKSHLMMLPLLMTMMPTLMMKWLQIPSLLNFRRLQSRAQKKIQSPFNIKRLQQRMKRQSKWRTKRKPQLLPVHRLMMTPTLMMMKKKKIPSPLDMSRLPQRMRKKPTLIAMEASLRNNRKYQQPGKKTKNWKKQIML
mmetsp:Transcript_13981/g.30442  ORF Transcript_13981/g.30442 Transcript_13981/m.30442 type:complete len:245 (-) Transcript_13981:348-1082(-)